MWLIYSRRLKSKLESAETDEAVLDVGIQWAYDQVTDLVENGIAGIHLCTLNRSHSAIELIRRLRFNNVI